MNQKIKNTTTSFTFAVVLVAEAVVPQSAGSTHDAADAGRTWPLVTRVT